MEQQELLDKILNSFRRYYDIKKEGIRPPYVAEAIYHSQDERYFISKEVKLFESESHEYVFFVQEDILTEERLLALDQQTWEEGLSRVRLTENHQNTDVALILIANHIDSEAKELIGKINHYKSYWFRLRGWSDYRIVALEIASGEVFGNPRSDDLKKLLSKIN